MIIQSALLSLILTALIPTDLSAIGHSTMPQPEPIEHHLVNEDVNIVPGLHYPEYSLYHNGIVDYKTARQIIISEYNEHWNTVIYTKEHPLFY